jgi:hypothetical protein
MIQVLYYLLQYLTLFIYNLKILSALILSEYILINAQNLFWEIKNSNSCTLWAVQSAIISTGHQHLLFTPIHKCLMYWVIITTPVTPIQLPTYRVQCYWTNMETIFDHCRYHFSLQAAHQDITAGWAKWAHEHVPWDPVNSKTCRLFNSCNPVT